MKANETACPACRAMPGMPCSNKPPLGKGARYHQVRITAGSVAERLRNRRDGAGGHIQVCISMSETELELIDGVAARMKISRSELLVRAAEAVADGRSKL